MENLIAEKPFLPAAGPSNGQEYFLKNLMSLVLAFAGTLQTDSYAFRADHEEDQPPGLL